MGRDGSDMVGARKASSYGFIGNPHVKAAVDAMMEQASIPPSAIAEAVGFAIDQPASVDVNELIVRPTAQG